MSWLNLNQSLNSLKGQLTNFASEVLAEGAGGSDAEGTACILEAADTRLHELSEKCQVQDQEISALRKLNSDLQTSLQTHKQHRNERASLQNGDVREDDEPWFWDPPPAQSSPRQPRQADSRESDEAVKIQAMQNEISDLKLKLGAGSESLQHTENEVKRLREENENLTSNLEDLDQQHQQAMERLLTLKKELQKNFEILKREHEELKSTNDRYAVEIEQLKSELAKKDTDISRMREMSKADYETLQHKYVNLERVYNVLQETTEKFQEENQELQEEVFKLQEILSNRDHEDDVVQTNQSDMVPKEKYEALLKEVMQVRENEDSTVSLHLDDTNIDDNAKSVIKNLKDDISDLKRKLASTSDQDASTIVARGIDMEKLVGIYNQYINFDLSGEQSDKIISTTDEDVIHKIEFALKNVSSLKKELDNARHIISENALNERYLQTQVDDLTSDNEILSADLTHCERELSEMKKNNDFLLSEITAMKNASKLEPIIESHEDNIVKLETELADCNQINKTFENEIKTIQKKLCEVHEEKVSLQSDLGDLRKKYNEMLLELDSYKAKSAVIQDLENFVENDEHTKLQKAVEEIEELKRKLNVAASRNEQLSIDYSIAQNETIIQTQKVDELKRVLEEREMKEKKITILEKKLDDLENNVSEVTKLKKEVELDRQLIFEKVRALAKETENLEQIDRYYDTFQNSTQDIDKNIGEIISRLVQSKKTESELVSEIAELKKCNSSQNESETANLRSKLEKEIMELKEDNKRLVEIKTQLENDLKLSQETFCASSGQMDKVIAELKNKQAEIEKLRSTSHLSISKETCSLQEKVDNLNSELQTYKNIAEESTAEISKLRSRISEYESELEKLKANIAEKEKEVEGLREDKLNILETKAQLEHELASSRKNFGSVENQVLKLEAELKDKQNEIEHLLSTTDCHNENLTTLNEAIDSLKNAIEIKDAEIYHLQGKDRLHASNVDSSVSNEIQDEINSLNKEIVELKTKLAHKDGEMNEFRSQIENLRAALDEKHVALDKLNSEKNELINFITVKHNENVQYHSEIQRLNQVMLQHINEYKTVAEERDRLKVELENCSECVKLKMIIKEKDEKFMQIHENSGDSEVTKRDLANATEIIRNLTEKCEELDKNLTIQLSEVKSLTTEKAQLSEREQSLSRELERLRRHLVETEESHTQEMLAAESRHAEYRTQLASIEERAKQTGTVYTSNNIRAQQELDTLRTQLRLLERQREEAQARLAGAEDDCQRSRAALANLQLVIEQFQSEKERDIEAATARVRSREEDVRRANAALRGELAALSARLDESLVGLQAASRLGDQLEMKNAQLQDYKEQVAALQETARAAEERYLAATRQHERVDKGLVKNLLLNYLQAADKRAADKIQVLRILSTVLDFNQQECERVGLARAAHLASTDSLAREFVRFLEKESRPTVLPTMLGLAQSSPATTSRSTTPQSRKNSYFGPPPVLEPPAGGAGGHRRTASSSSNNALFQHMDPPPTDETAPDVDRPGPSLVLQPGVNQTRNTEGAILKHVLKDI